MGNAYGITGPNGVGKTTILNTILGLYNKELPPNVLKINGFYYNDIDFEFVHKLAAECPAKIIAEGHIHYPEQAVKALEAGAFALVVGGAITRPAEITARFTGAINAMHK